MEDGGDGWLTYQQAGDRLGVSPEAVRAKAARKRWRRQLGNDGLARVWLPEEERPAGDRPITGRTHKPGDRPVTPRSPADRSPLVHALQSHVADLREQLAAAAARIERLETEFAARDAQHAAEIAVEREKAERARAELSIIADRLAAIAEANQRSRSWWPWRRRLAG